MTVLAVVDKTVHMQTNGSTKGYFTKKEAAFYSAVSVKTLSRWLQEGLPAIQVRRGGRVLIRLTDLDAFLNGKRVIQSTSLDNLVETTLRELTQNGN